MPRQKEPPIIMDEIPRTYYPGRGFLTDQEAYPTDLYGNVRPPSLDTFDLKYDPTRDGTPQFFDLKYDPTRDGTPQIIPLPYPVPMPGNQGNNQGGFNVGRALGSIAGSLGMGLGDPAFSPGLAGRYGDYLAEGPSFEIPQGQGRNPDYSIYNDPRMPGARKLRRKLEGILGLPRVNFPQAQGMQGPTPGISLFRGPQFGQA